MVLPPIARSLAREGLSSLLKQVSRPAGIAAFDAARHADATTASGIAGQSLQNGGTAEAPLASTRLNADTASPAFAVTVLAHLRTFASAAVDEGIQSQSREGRTDRRRQHGKGTKRSVTGKPVREKKDPRWPAARREFLRLVRAAEPDANVDELLTEGQVAGLPVDAKLVQSVLFHIALGKDPSEYNEVKAENPDEAEDFDPEASLETVAQRSIDQAECSPEDARRALNLFRWWQNKNPDTPQLALVNPLFKALVRGGYMDDVRSIWEEYKQHAKDDSRLVADILMAFLYKQMYPELLAVHKEAVDNNWPMTGRANDFALQAMQHRGASGEEMFALYKHAVESGKGGLQDRHGFATLLKGGITVEQIRSVGDKAADGTLNRLIQALMSLDRKDEAAELAKELAERDQPQMSLVRFVAILMTLVNSGFKEEAQKVADAQGKQHGVRLDGALAFMIRAANNAKTSIYAYKSLSDIEGPHRTSILVESALIACGYHRLKMYDKMLEAYERGKGFKGHFDSTVFGPLLWSMSTADRTSDVERILPEYFHTKKTAPVYTPIGFIQDGVLHSIAKMYLRLGQPEKIVDLAKTLVAEKHYVKAGWMEYWAKTLREGGHAAAAEELEMAEEDMRKFRPKYDDPNRFQARSHLHKDVHAAVEAQVTETEEGRKVAVATE